MLDIDQVLQAISRQRTIDRRLFLAFTGSLSSIPLLGNQVLAEEPPAFTTNPFQLGVASGDPAADGMVLWTRLAPRPLDPDAGMPPQAIQVTWEVATDESMRHVVQSGNATASPALGHSVHVEVEGLLPNRWYWYRFRAGEAESTIGRTRTLPSAEATPRELRFAFASCQNYEEGYYTAYENMAREELDFMVHLGDYIYEYAAFDNRVRKHIGQEITSLADYRVRYSQYKSDPHLQAMHARCPWLVVWDDHEFDNNYANDISEQANVSAADFLLRRANAYQAYYENMPLRSMSVPKGPDMQLYRKISFGNLAALYLLDTRQYRTDQPNADGQSDINAAALAENATMLGGHQRKWLEKSLLQSSAKWNVLAQQVMMGVVDMAWSEPRRFWMDEWPGYMHERKQIAKFLQDRQISNPIVLTGDYHANWVNDLRVDDRHSDTPVFATEFVGTSISSEGDGVERPGNWEHVTNENACVRFYNQERGYVRCTVTQDSWQSDFRIVPTVTQPTSSVLTRKSYVVAAGKPGAELL